MERTRGRVEYDSIGDAQLDVDINGDGNVESWVRAL